jgi:hypothetical protein
MTYVFSAILILHGAIHLMGFAKAFGLAQLDQLTLPVTPVAGAFWLLAAVLFMVAGGMALASLPSWWMPALPALVISQVLIVLAWRDAWAGTIPNLIVLVALIPAIAASLPNAYGPAFRRLSAENLARPLAQTTLLTEADLVSLPAPVATYLRRTGSVGKPRVRSFHVEMNGEFARDQKRPKERLHYTAEQNSFLDASTRLFFMRAAMWGVPMAGLHVYDAQHASMHIKVAELFEVADAHGQQMDQGEAVTYLNDLCFLAPAALVDAGIEWEQLDPRHVKATFTKSGQTVSAVLIFDEAGDLVDFYSDDRFLSADGATYTSWRWRTPITEYRELPDGRRQASKGSAIWETPDGEFEYITFNLNNVTFNMTGGR